MFAFNFCIIFISVYILLKKIISKIKNNNNEIEENWMKWILENCKETFLLAWTEAEGIITLSAQPLSKLFGFVQLVIAIITFNIIRRISRVFENEHLIQCSRVRDLARKVCTEFGADVYKPGGTVDNGNNIITAS